MVMKSGETKSGLANPASVYAGQQGLQSRTKIDASGGQYAEVLVNGNWVEEWSYFRSQGSPNVFPLNNLKNPKPADNTIRLSQGRIQNQMPQMPSAPSMPSFDMMSRNREQERQRMDRPSLMPRMNNPMNNSMNNQRKGGLFPDLRRERLVD